MRGGKPHMRNVRKAWPETLHSYAGQSRNCRSCCAVRILRRHGGNSWRSRGSWKRPCRTSKPARSRRSGITPSSSGGCWTLRIAGSGALCSGRPVFGRLEGAPGPITAAFCFASALSEVGESSLYGGSLPAVGGKRTGARRAETHQTTAHQPDFTGAQSPTGLAGSGRCLGTRPNLRLLATLCMRRCLRTGLGGQVFYRPDVDRTPHPLCTL